VRRSKDEHVWSGMKKIVTLGLVWSFSYSDIPVSMQKFDANVAAAKLPKKAEDWTFKH
jgi:hypothetical protein